MFFFFFFNDTATTEIYTLSLHDALPISLDHVLVTINPVVLELGPLAVRWFGLLALVGLLLAVWLSLRDLRRRGLGRQPALGALAWGLPAGLLVGRLVHVLGWGDCFLTNPSARWQL